MDSRIGIAARAIPKLEGLIHVKVIEWLTTAALLEHCEEELFFDPNSLDVYVSFTAGLNVRGISKEKSCIAKITTQGVITWMAPEEIIALNLDDITHLIPEVAEEIKRESA